MRKVLPTIIIGLIGLVSFTGCANLENKAVAIAGSVNGIKVETTGSTTTGTVMPNAMIAAGMTALATSPLVETGNKTVCPVFIRIKQNSLIGAIFGIDNSTEIIEYIGIPGESAADTAKRVNSLNGLTPSTQTDSGTAGAK